VLPTADKTSHSAGVTLTGVPAVTYKVCICYRPALGTGSGKATGASAALKVTP
jgi:hypothetical protein